MKRSESIAELAKALSAFQGEVPPVPKASENPFFSSSYADLADVVKVAAPHLAAHGLSISQDPETVDGKDVLTTLLMHSSGEWKESSVELHIEKANSQGHGSAITYMRRYCYCAILGIVADADDDGNAASENDHISRSSGMQSNSYAAKQAATDAQMSYLLKLADETLTDVPQAELTAGEASALIDQMLAKKKSKVSA